MTKLRVLIVDDNEDHRFLTQRAIRALGIDAEVFAAGSGDEGLKRVENDAPNLVLLDIKMPGTDGFEVLRRIRERDASRSLPVVMFSSSENVADQQRAEALGASGFVTKPLDAKSFTNIVRETVSAWAERLSSGGGGEQPLS